MYSEYKRTSGTETGTMVAERTLARARLALSVLGTMWTSRPSRDEVRVAQPERLAEGEAHAGLCQKRQQKAVPQVLASRQDRHDLAWLQGARSARCGTCSFTGLTGMGRPLVTWCRNGLYEPRLIRRQATSSAATESPVRAWWS